MSKKIGLIAVLTVIMVLSITSLAFAAQNVQFNGSNNGFNDFAATPKVFNADGTSNYPNEIYLPNEQNPAQYAIHSNYTSTTDACASCHSTHTAVGEALLQWGSVTETCMACHDGTVTTTYNVIDGKIGATDARTSAGLFGHPESQVSKSEKQDNGVMDAGLSNHNVSGSMNIYAAPGGPGTAGIDAPSWDKEFDCASCHTPHGMGGNARLLNPDVNGVATANYKSTNRFDLKEDGNGGFVSDWDNDGVNDTWLWSGHGYSNKVGIWDKNGTALSTADYTLSNTTGRTIVTITNPNVQGPFKANFIAAVKVQMTVNNKLQATESVQQQYGLNDFCGACHVDYNTTDVSSPHANLNGTYTEAYRHKVGRSYSSSAKLAPYNMKLESFGSKTNIITCETCHVAHGTDNQYWQDTLGNTGIATAQLTEVAGSSALKRLPNMGTCEVCHAKGEASQGTNAGATPVSNVIASNPGGGYVGKSACASCHGGTSEHYNQTWHPDISRPGLPKKIADEAATQSDASLDSVVPGFAQAIRTTQAELGKIGWDAEGRLPLEPAAWSGKQVVANNVKVWSTGTGTGSEIMVRGSVLQAAGVTEPAPVADRWYIVAVLDENGKIVVTKESDGVTPAAPEDYGCGTRGCHTTGYKADGKTLTGASSDFTVWLNAAAAGTKVPFELGVGCESCHGQGGNHVKAPSASNIVNPIKAELRVQTVGQQADGHGNFTNFDSNKAFIDYVGGVGNAMACAKCHNGGHHQGDFYSDTANKNAWPTTDGLNAHFLDNVASCNTCHNSHEESVDAGQMKLPTIAQTCQQCHSSRGNRNADGTVNGVTFEEGSTTRIIHTFPSNH